MVKAIKGVGSIFDRPPPTPAETLARLTAQAAAGTLSIQDIPGCETAKRAMEIAAIGNHTAALMGQTDTDRHLLGLLAIAFRQSGAPVTMVSPADAPEVAVYCAIPDVDFMLPPPAERTATILARIAATKPRVTELQVDHPARQLLGEAKLRGVIDDACEARVVRVSHTIAATEGARMTLRRHIAEALSYVYPHADGAPPADYLPISTAPRGGTLVKLAAFDAKGQLEVSVKMCWQADARNPLFPGIVGFWVTPDFPGPHSFTWNESDPDAAPTHWQPVRTN